MHPDSALILNAAMAFDSHNAIVKKVGWLLLYLMVSMLLTLQRYFDRKDKARKLKQLQAELLTLEDDINAVAGRKALAPQPDAALSAAAADGAEPANDGYPAVLAGLHAPQLPAELLQIRLNGHLEENGDHQPPSPQSGTAHC